MADRWPVRRAIWWVLLFAGWGTEAVAGNNGGCEPVIIFEEDFGAGAVNPGTPPPAGTTTYCFEDLTGTCMSSPTNPPGVVDDGSYSILNDPQPGLFVPGVDSLPWISHPDHTPGDTNGYMLVVNADFEPGEFYRINDIYVIEGTGYRFSAWFSNVLSEAFIGICGSAQAPVNVAFRVEDAGSGALLGEYTTGDLYATGVENWVEGAFEFMATSPVINVVLVNNARGGCGNDFALDDIRLTGCAANTTVAVDDTLITEASLTGYISLAINDFDPEGHDQRLEKAWFDADGDLSVDSELTIGEERMIGGADDEMGAVIDAGSVVLSEDRDLMFFPDAGFSGQAALSYTVCDNGLPSACDTAFVIILVGKGEIGTCMIPDVITPNGDGLNDAWIIPCGDGLRQLQVEVYNRWGNQVFDSGPGYDGSWQGTWGREGKPLPEGVYFYVVRFGEAALPDAAGDLTILR